MTTLLVVAGVAALEWAVLLCGIRLGERRGYDRAERLGRIALERERLPCRRAAQARRERLTALFGPNVAGRPGKAPWN